MFYKISYKKRMVAVLLTAAVLSQDAALAAPGIVSDVSTPRYGHAVVSSYGLSGSVALAGDSFAGDGRSDLSLILIEDAHTNPSGQINLASTLDAVLTKHRTNVVFTEGSDKDVSLSGFRRYGTSSSRAAAAMPLLRKGLLKGSEFLELTRPEDFSIIGVEDRRLYERAVAQYGRTVASRGRTAVALDRVRSAFDAVADRSLNPGLNDLRTVRKGYASGEISASEYFARLAVWGQELGVADADMGQLERLARIQEIEKLIDFESAARQWTEALALMSEEERTAFGSMSVETLRKNDLQGAAAAGARIKKVLKGRSVGSDLGRYLDYLEHVAKVDPHRLIAQSSKLERDVEARLAVTPEEARFVRLERAAEHLNDLSDLSLTPEGAAYLDEMGDDAALERITGFLNRRIMQLGIAPERAVLMEQARDRELTSARDFYRTAADRDLVILERALRSARERKQETAVLITGGYHTRHLTDLLKERGIAYQVLTPQVYEETDRARYERLLLSQNGPSGPGGSTSSALITLYNADSPQAMTVLKAAFEALGSTESDRGLGSRTDPRPRAEEGARMSATAVTGFRRVLSLPIYARIPMSRRLLAELMYQRMRGIGEAMQLDEAFFKHTVLEIVRTCDLRLAWDQSRYVVTDKNARNEPIGRSPRVKNYARLIGWQEKWYDVWSELSRSSSDPAQALRFMSMAEFLGDVGVDESGDHTGVTGDIFVQGRLAAYGQMAGYGPDNLPAVEAFSVPMDGGDDIPMRLVRPRQALTQQVPVAVLYHGFGMSGASSYFDEMEEKLVAQGIAVLRPDLLGHGQSHRALGSASQMLAYNNAIAAFLKSNAKNLRSDRIGMYGFSFGAYLALRAAMESDLGPMIEALAIMNPPTAETFTRNRIFEWHAPLLRELFPVEDFQSLVDKMEELEYPLARLIRPKSREERLEIGRRILLFLSDHDETIHFRDQHGIRRFARLVGVKPVVLHGQGHFAVGAAYHSAIDAAVRHLAERLPSGARLADTGKTHWFRERIAEAVHAKGHAKILAVCTANFHRSAAIEWLLGAEAEGRGWSRLVVESAGTAWWDRPTLFGSLWDAIHASITASLTDLPEDLPGEQGIRDYLAAVKPDAVRLLSGEAGITQEEARDFYLYFDHGIWDGMWRSDNPYREDDWRRMGRLLGQVYADAETDLYLSTRIRNGDFRSLTREVSAQIHPDKNARERLLAAQERYGHPKPLSRSAVEEADVILIAGEDHRDAVLQASPEAASKMVKLSELIPHAFNPWIGSGDIPDPGRSEIEEEHLVRALMYAVRYLLDALNQQGHDLSGDDLAQRLRRVHLNLRHARALYEQAVRPEDRTHFARGRNDADLSGPEGLSAVERMQRLQSRLTQNYERVAGHDQEIGRLIDESDRTLEEMSVTGESHELYRKRIAALRDRIAWIRIKLAERMFQKGQWGKGTYVLMQILRDGQRYGHELPVELSGRLYRLNHFFTNYRNARVQLMRGELEEADRSIQEMRRSSEQIEPLMRFIEMYRQKILEQSSPEEALRQGQRPWVEADKVPSIAGHAMAVHGSLSHPELVYKKALMPQTDIETEALEMAKIAARRGFEVRRIGGYWMVQIDGFVPFGFEDEWIVQPQVDPLPSLSEIPEAEREALLSEVLAAGEALRSAGIEAHDLKPNNFTRDPDRGLLVFDYGFIYDDPAPPQGARMAAAPPGVRSAEPVNQMMMALSVRDLGAVEVDAAGQTKIGVDMRKGLEAVQRLLPVIHAQGTRKLYLYGVLSSGEMSESIHTAPDGPAHAVFSKDGRVAVWESGYAKHRETVGGRSMDNSAGSMFSSLDLGAVHPGTLEPGEDTAAKQEALERQLRALVRLAKENFGISVYLDFIPWRAPEAVTKENYKSFYYRELSYREQKEYDKLPAGDHPERRAWISRILQRAGDFTAVRVPKGKGETLIFTRRADIGIPSEDQLVPNPFHPQTQRYWIENLKRLVDWGVAGVRVDLGWRILADWQYHYYREMGDFLRKRGITLEDWMRSAGIEDLAPGETFDDWWQRQRRLAMPWRQIISEVGAYSRTVNRRPFDFIIEVYQDAYSEEVKQLLALGVKRNYDDRFFKAVVDGVLHKREGLLDAVRKAVAASPHGMIFLSNYDQNALMNLLEEAGVADAKKGLQLILSVLGRLGVPVMVDGREFIEEHGQAVPMVGGGKPGADDFHAYARAGELDRRGGAEWPTQVYQSAPWNDLLHILESKLGKPVEPKDIWVPGNNSAKHRYVPIFWRDAERGWFLFLADLHPSWGPKQAFGPGKIKIELTASEMPASMDPAAFVRGFDPSKNVLMGDADVWRMSLSDWNSPDSKERTLDLDLKTDGFRGANLLMYLGPAVEVPESSDPIRHIFAETPIPGDREAALLDLLSQEGVPDATLSQALWLAMVDPYENVRATAANVLAHWHLDYEGPHQSADKWLSSLLDPIAVRDQAGIEQTGYRPRHGMRNGRYAVLHALKLLSWMARGEWPPTGGSGTEYAASVIGELRKRAAAEAGAWNKQKDTKVRRIVRAELKVTHPARQSPERRQYEWDRDLSLGSERLNTVLQILRAVVVRSEEVASHYPAGRRDTFYWVLEAVREIVPDIPGDPVADVVYRGSTVSGARMAAQGQNGGEEPEVTAAGLMEMLWSSKAARDRLRTLAGRMEGTPNAWHWHVLMQLISEDAAHAGGVRSVMAAARDIGIQEETVRESFEALATVLSADSGSGKMGRGARMAAGGRPADVDAYWKGMWDAHIEMFDGRRPKALEETVVNELQGIVGEGDTIVELGAGGEAVTARALTDAFPGVKVIAVDPNVDAKKISADLPSNIRYLSKPAASTGLKANSAQAVVSVFGIDYEDREAAVSEIWRILKPGGRAVLILHHPDSHVTQDQVDHMHLMEESPRAQEHPELMKMLRANVEFYTHQLFSNVWEGREFFRRRGAGREFDLLRFDELLLDSGVPLGYVCVIEKSDLEDAIARLRAAHQAMAKAAKRPAARKKARSSGARMAQEYGVVSANDAEGPALVSRRTRLEAENGLHSRPSMSLQIMMDHVDLAANMSEKHVWLRVRKPEFREPQRAADGTHPEVADLNSILSLLELGVTDQTELILEVGGDLDVQQANELADVFSDLLADRSTLSQGLNHSYVAKEEYRKRIYNIFDPDTFEFKGPFDHRTHLRWTRVSHFLEDVIDAHPSVSRAHVPLEGDGRTLTVFQVWRDGRSVWYALKGQHGRMRVEAIGPDLPEDLPAYTPRVDAEVDQYTDMALMPDAAVSLDLSLAEELVRWAGTWLGADLGQTPVLANVEVDLNDLIARVGYGRDEEFAEDLRRRLKTLQTRIQGLGMGRLIFDGQADGIAGAPTVRLYHPKNQKFADAAAPGTLKWSYEQGQRQILPVLSSTILSALMAAAPEEGRVEYLTALTPLYQRLVGSSDPGDRLTPELLAAARSNPDVLKPIQPLTLLGYLDVAVYLQQLSRQAARMSA